MTLLESINSPADLRALSTDQLRTVADEIRAYILETMSRVGGHTGASLGAVELAVALLAALEATLRLYLEGSAAMEAIPTLRCIALPAEAIRARAETVSAAVREAGYQLA